MENNKSKILISVFILLFVIQFIGVSMVLNHLKEIELSFHSDLSSLRNQINTLENKTIGLGNLPNQTTKAKDVMSPLELAEYLNIDVSKVFALTESKPVIPHMIISGEYRFNKSAVDEWMKTHIGNILN